MNQFHDNMDREAQELLGDVFGEKCKYKITDGDEGYLDAQVVGSDDYEANDVHVEYENVSRYTFLTNVRIVCSFPDWEDYEEISRNDEPTETGDVGCDFEEEVRNECGSLYGGNDDVKNSDLEIGDEYTQEESNGYRLNSRGGINLRDIIIELEYGTDEEKTPDSGDWLDGINEDLKKLKEIIDSYKKKTAKKGS